MRYDILTPLRDPGVKPRQHTVGGPRGLAYGNDKLVVNSLFFSTVALPARAERTFLTCAVTAYPDVFKSSVLALTLARHES